MALFYQDFADRGIILIAFHAVNSHTWVAATFSCMLLVLPILGDSSVEAQ
jgi:hypothetical protein